MARLIARVKILPDDIDRDLDMLKNAIKESLPSDISIKAEMKEPIAFGLNALLIDFVMDDKEGHMDRLEDIIRNTQGVSEIQVISLSRSL